MADTTDSMVVNIDNEAPLICSLEHPVPAVYNNCGCISEGSVCSIHKRGGNRVEFGGRCPVASCGALGNTICDQCTPVVNEAIKLSLMR